MGGIELPFSSHCSLLASVQVKRCLKLHGACSLAEIISVTVQNGKILKLSGVQQKASESSLCVRIDTQAFSGCQSCFKLHSVGQSLLT
jgi:hypothetical protein